MRSYLNKPNTVENVLKNIIVNNNLSYGYKEYHFFKSSLISLISYLIDLGEIEYILDDGQLLLLYQKQVNYVKIDVYGKMR